MWPLLLVCQQASLVTSVAPFLSFNQTKVCTLLVPRIGNAYAIANVAAPLPGGPFNIDRLVIDLRDGPPPLVVDDLRTPPREVHLDTIYASWSPEALEVVGPPSHASLCPHHLALPSHLPFNRLRDIVLVNVVSKDLVGIRTYGFLDPLVNVTFDISKNASRDQSKTPGQDPSALLESAVTDIQASLAHAHPARRHACLGSVRVLVATPEDMARVGHRLASWHETTCRKAVPYSSGATLRFVRCPSIPGSEHASHLAFPLPSYG